MYHIESQQKHNKMFVISSSEFRQNQKHYFDRIDKGERIVIQRGKAKSYLLTPVKEDDLYFNAEMLDRIKRSIEETQIGISKTVTSSKGIKELLAL